MAPEKGKTLHGISSRFKSAFMSKKSEQIESSRSSEAIIVRNDQRKFEAEIGENTADQDISIILWNDAYNNISADKNKKNLILTYERLLTKLASHDESSMPSGSEVSEEANRFKDCDGKTRISEMQSVVNTVLEEIEKHSKAKSYVIQGAEIFDNAKEIISQALTSYPPAALAFSGLCVALPFMIKPLKQTKAMADGLLHVLDSLTWYMALSRLLLRNFGLGGDFAQFRNTMKDKVVALYQSLLEYQIKCVIRRFDTSRIVRSARAMIGLEDWDGSQKEFLEFEDAFKADTQQYNDELMKGLTAQSNGNQQVIVSELRRTNKERQQKVTGRFNGGCKGYMERNNPKPVPGTCVWFTGHDRFQAWTDDESNLLIVSADPGCGKSVLARHLVDTVLPRRLPNCFICHFFFKDDGEQRDLSTGLSCIIHQLLSQTESLSESAKKAILEAGEPLKNWRILWDILLLLLREIDNVIILLDALDEMDPRNFEELITKLHEKLLPNLTTGSNTKFLVTTRPYDLITKPLKSVGSSLIHLQGEGKKEIDEIQEEIKLVVQHRLQEFKKSHLHLRDDVIKALKESFERKGQDQRTYLWVRLAFELLDKDTSYLGSEKHWKGIVDSISKGHIEIYEELLQLVSIEDKEDVRIVMCLMISATSPWTTRDLDIALAVRNEFLVNPNAQYQDEKNLDCRDERMADWIRNTCRCFVTVYDSRVYFIHQTAKEFLLSLKTTSEVQPSIQYWHASISLRQAEVTALESWIAYICMMRFPGVSQSHIIFGRKFIRTFLLDFRDCQVFKPLGTTTSNKDSTMKVLDVSEPFQSSYYTLWEQPFQDQFSWLHIMYVLGCYDHRAFDEQLDVVFELQPFPAFNIVVASYFGQYNALIRLVSSYGSLLNKTDKGKAVIASAMGGNMECLRYLLNHDYPADTPFEITKEVNDGIYSFDAYSEVFGNSALHWAAIWGNREMAQLLLDHGAKVDAHSLTDERTPAVNAIRNSWSKGHPKRQLYLGRMSPSPELRADVKYTSSGCGESNWDRSLLKLFVENGANLNDALMGKSILYEAVDREDENATKFLLQYCLVDANVGSHRDVGFSPLHLALRYQQHRICMLLLGAGADASTLCSKAISVPQVLKMILGNVSTLYTYMDRGIWNDLLLTSLLKKGGKRVVNTKITVDYMESDWPIPDVTNNQLADDFGGATCLHRYIEVVCTRDFNPSYVEKLVRYGANVNEPDANGRTPLHIACSDENKIGISITLLGFGGDPTLKDNGFQTPLDITRRQGMFIPPSDEQLEFLQLCENYLKDHGLPSTKPANIEF